MDGADELLQIARAARDVAASMGGRQRDDEPESIVFDATQSAFEDFADGIERVASRVSPRT